jgi:hypothetical protein
MRTLTRVESDHNTFLLEDRTNVGQSKRPFRFEMAWLSNLDFKSKLIEK